MRKVLAKRVLAIALLLCILCLVFGSCSEKSSFSITFINVGQGDAALVECDGHYMLIDGGGVLKGEKVKETLKENGVKKLDILVISHLHEDHYGGIAKGLEALQVEKIDITISNSIHTDQKSFVALVKELERHETEITIPTEKDTYDLGSASIEVVDVKNEDNNDSLVLLITYKNARFLFTGDIEKSGQERVAKYLENHEKHKDGKNWISLIKMPHHGAYNDDAKPAESTLNDLLNQYAPKYFVISVGDGYGHPHEDTLQLIKNKKGLYRTDIHGDITVRYKRGKLIFETTKKK